MRDSIKRHSSVDKAIRPVAAATTRKPDAEQARVKYWRMVVTVTEIKRYLTGDHDHVYAQEDQIVTGHGNPVVLENSAQLHVFELIDCHMFPLHWRAALTSRSVRRIIEMRRVMSSWTSHICFNRLSLYASYGMYFVWITQKAKAVSVAT